MTHMLYGPPNASKSKSGSYHGNNYLKNKVIVSLLLKCGVHEISSLYFYRKKCELLLSHMKVLLFFIFMHDVRCVYVLKLLKLYLLKTKVTSNFGGVWMVWFVQKL
ncbi:hypothetical protein PIB30_048502 [Stylosanthes scabra]|uniref:Uncharacterized protein n=1 Tax=Stylosanthes scabra TaxID=79078 RepID=A0ABU6TIZ6_9FABA|nr:hypothetical protein [Stylosanthes scabra]